MVSRRQFLRGNPRSSSDLRPPWAIEETEFVASCTRCDACVQACPEGILVRGDGGFPAIRYARGGCTYCRACVESCEPKALSPNVDPPVPWMAVVTDSCVAAKGVQCRSCGEECERRAISFQLQLGGKTKVNLDQDVCNGCGACLRVCPVNAIRLNKTRQPQESA